MGFVLSILYFLTYYLTPTTIFGSLAEYRIELIFAIVLIIVSIPALLRTSLWKVPQTPALFGLLVATYMSILVGMSWAGGGVDAVLAFIPNAFAFFMIYLHCVSKRKLQIVILMMLFICVFVIAQGAIELHQGGMTGEAARQANANANGNDSYFIGMTNNDREWFYRLQGKGQIADPNDFAQVITCTLPLMFFFWKPKRKIRNFFLVLIPVGVLLWGIYLTHSRGGMLGLLAIVIVALRRRIGTVPAIILAALLFVGVSATNFAGGRDISVSAGQDRTALWGDGLELLKIHPLFGAGFGNMADIYGQTAHNTIVVCAAELGLCGLYFWSMFLLPSIKDATAVAFRESPQRHPVIVSDQSYPEAAPSLNIPDEAEIARFASLLVLSFTGFLVTGWFLSRAFVLTLFLLGGLTEVTFEMARQRGMVGARLPFGRLARYSGVMTLGLILLIYIMLRVVNLTH
jgi:O-antigen ligase